MSRLIIAEFEVGGDHYCVNHNNDTDARTIETPEADIVLTITSNLLVIRGGKAIGEMFTSSCERGLWTFASSNTDEYPNHTTEIICKGYSYNNLLKAEIEIATKLIEHIGSNAETEIVLSANDEFFGAESVEELIHDDTDGCLMPGSSVSYGEKVDIEPTDLVSADYIIDQANESLFDMMQDPDELEATQEARAELDDLLTAWFNKHCPITYYKVKNIKQYIITEQDFINAGVEIGGQP